MTAITDISDDEVVMELFRLARSGKHHSVGSLLDEAQELFGAAVTLERLNGCLKQLAMTLWRNDYMGYASEYRT